MKIGQGMLYLGELFIITFIGLIAYVIAQLSPLIGLLETISPLQVGMAVFFFGCILYAVFKMSRLQAEARDKFTQTFESLTGLRKAVKLVDEKIVAVENSPGKNKELISEVKVLQTLLSQMATARLDSKEKSKPAKSSPSGKKSGSKSNTAEPNDRKTLGDDEIRKVMHNALKENRIDLYVQPIVSLPSRKHVHYECYSRVRDETGDTIFAREYMPLAERSGLTGTLDNLLLFRLIQLIRKLGHRRPETQFFCNISSYSMNDSEFFPQFIEFMLSNGRLSDRLVFEFAQEDVLNMSRDVERSLLTLGQKGFRFSIDNVETLDIDITGLAQRYFRFIKVDVDVLKKGGGNIHPGDLSEALSRNEIILIASKIEEEKTVVDVLDYNIEFGQGYLLGEPKINTVGSEGSDLGEGASAPADLETLIESERN